MKKQSFQILIIDDAPDLIKLLAYILRSKNFEVLTALSGQEALDVLQMNKPDLVITDGQLLDMDGSALTARIKDQFKEPLIPVIMLTGSVDDESKEKAMDAGVDFYMKKPFQTPELLSAIEKLLY